MFQGKMGRDWRKGEIWKPRTQVQVSPVGGETRTPMNGCVPGADLRKQHQADHVSGQAWRALDLVHKLRTTKSMDDIAINDVIPVAMAEHGLTVLA